MLTRRGVVFAYNLNKQLFKILEMPFYAVAKGRVPGIYATWPDCEAQVKGFNGPKFRKFNTKSEADAFIAEFGAGSTPKKEKKGGVVDKRPKNTISNTIPSGASYIDLTYAPSRSSSSSSSSSSRAGVQQVGTSSTTNGVGEDGRMSPTLLSMQKDMKRLQKELSVLRDKFDNYISTRGIHTATETKAKKRKRNPGSVDSDIGEATPSSNTNDQNKFQIDEDGFLIVYTDGACEGNGRHGARAGVGVYFGPEHPLNVSEPVRGRATNNTAEIQACTYALELAQASGFNKVKISTDSMFTINCMTKWIRNWQKNGWKKTNGEPVINKEDLTALDSATDGLCIKWDYVKGHAGIPGNEAADRLAVAGAQRYVPGQSDIPDDDLGLYD